MPSNSNFRFFFGSNAWSPSNLTDEQFMQQMWDRYGSYQQRYTTGVDQCSCALHTVCRVHPTSRKPEPEFRRAYAQRVGPLEVTDGAARPDRVLWTWPMLWERLSPLERQLAHGPVFGQYGTIPTCSTCPDEYFWPCPWAEETLEHFGLTKHDLDYRPGDERAAD